MDYAWLDKVKIPIQFITDPMSDNQHWIQRKKEYGTYLTIVEATLKSKRWPKNEILIGYVKSN